MTEHEADLTEIKTILAGQARTLTHLTAEVAKHIKRSDGQDARIAQVEDFVQDTKTYMRGVKYLLVFFAGLLAAIAAGAAILQTIHTW